MGVIAGIEATHMIANKWKVMEGYVQLSLDNMKSLAATNKNSVKT